MGFDPPKLRVEDAALILPDLGRGFETGADDIIWGWVNARTRETVAQCNQRLLEKIDSCSKLVLRFCRGCPRRQFAHCTGHSVGQCALTDCKVQDRRITLQKLLWVIGIDRDSRFLGLRFFKLTIGQD